MTTEKADVSGLGRGLRKELATSVSDWADHNPADKVTTTYAHIMAILELLAQTSSGLEDRGARDLVFIEVLSAYESLRRYVALRHHDPFPIPEMWLVEHGRPPVEDVPEADDWRQRYFGEEEEDHGD
jgi:hypothetical protein